jgi:predicted membrane-bound spermidine synthase
MKKKLQTIGFGVKGKLYTASAVSGLCVMVLELTGSRMIAPFLGASIVVWTAIIGVIMASMAAGYYAGGRAADTRPSVRLLAAFIGGAALWVALLAFFQRAALMGLLAEDGGNIYALSVITALLFFAVPGFLLAAVTPFVIRLFSTGKEDIGGIAGRVSMFSTIGGIAGTFLGGFVLVSFFPVTVILLLTALVLGITALVTFSANIKTAALLCLAVIGAFAGLYRKLPQTRAIETAYNSLFVLEYVEDGRKTRALYTDSEKLQGRMFVDAPEEIAAPYLRFIAENFLNDEARTLLMFGGGIYTLPRWITAERPSTTVDVVEIDPGITKAARDFFRLRDRQGQRVIHEDARYFVNRLSQKAPDSAARYGIIFQDAYGSSINVPFQLTTVEFFKRVNTLLAEDGVFLLNFIGTLDSAMLAGLYASLGEAFPAVKVYPVTGSGNVKESQNIILAAYKNGKLGERDNMIDDWSVEAYSSFRNIPAFTDNFAPVERYTLQMRN